MIPFEVRDYRYLVAVLEWLDAMPESRDGQTPLEGPRVNNYIDALYSAVLVTPIPAENIKDVFLLDGEVNVEYVNSAGDVQTGIACQYTAPCSNEKQPADPGEWVEVFPPTSPGDGTIYKRVEPGAPELIVGDPGASMLEAIRSRRYELAEELKYVELSDSPSQLQWAIDGDQFKLNGEIVTFKIVKEGAHEGKCYLKIGEREDTGFGPHQEYVRHSYGYPLAVWESVDQLINAIVNENYEMF